MNRALNTSSKINSELYASVLTGLTYKIEQLKKELIFHDKEELWVQSAIRYTSAMWERFHIVSLMNELPVSLNDLFTEIAPYCLERKNGSVYLEFNGAEGKYECKKWLAHRASSVTMYGDQLQISHLCKLAKNALKLGLSLTDTQRIFITTHDLIADWVVCKKAQTKAYSSAQLHEISTVSDLTSWDSETSFHELSSYLIGKQALYHISRGFKSGIAITTSLKKEYCSVSPSLELFRSVCMGYVATSHLRSDPISMKHVRKFFPRGFIGNCFDALCQGLIIDKYPFTLFDDVSIINAMRSMVDKSSITLAPFLTASVTGPHSIKRMRTLVEVFGEKLSFGFDGAGMRWGMICPLGHSIVARGSSVPYRSVDVLKSYNILADHQSAYRTDRSLKDAVFFETTCNALELECFCKDEHTTCSICTHAQFGGQFMIVKNCAEMVEHFLEIIT